jgi:hypothetical protein
MCCDTACCGEVSHEVRSFGAGQRRMMPHDAFRPPWKLLAPLFGKLGGISKIGVVNIDILRDDRFDPSVDTIGCLSLLNPDRPQ